MTDSALHNLRRLVSLVRPHMALLSVAMICETAKQLVTIAIGVLGVLLIVSAKEKVPESVLFVLGAGIVVLSLIRGICGYFGPYLNHVAAFRVLTELRDALYRKIDPLAPAIFVTRRTGDLVSVAINNIEILELFFAHTLSQILVAIIIPLFVLCSLAWIHPCLAAIMFIFLLLSSLVPALTIHVNEKKGDRLRMLMAGLHSFLIDSVQGIWEILAFGRGEARLSGMKRMILDYRKEQRRYVRVTALSSGTFAVLVSAGVVTLLIASTLLAEAGLINSFYLPIVVILAGGAFSALKEVAEVSKQLGLTVAGARRFFAIMDEIPPVREEERPASPPSGIPSLAIKDLSFRYGENEPLVLRGVNFTVPSGSTTAIVGMTGAGKTTITHLLMRFYDPQSGQVLIDGKDIRTLRLQDLRQMISLVSQDIFLFNTSIRENIRIGRADATDEEVEQAARFARIHEFISGLPEGYSTLVGERGIRLSGGERQRVAIARAILKDAPVLIMDEATSNLDTSTEFQIRETIRMLMKGRTVFLIAHRLSTVVSADMILVMDQGEIVEEGSHQELLEKRGMYASLIEAQVI